MAAVEPLAQALRFQGADVDVVGPDGVSTRPEATEMGSGSGLRQGFRRTMPWLRVLAEVRGTWRSLAGFAATRGRFVVHVHGVWRPANVAACMFCRFHRLPYVISPHGMLLPGALERSRKKKAVAVAAYVRRHLEKAAAVHVTSEAERDSVVAVAPRAQIEVIPWGIEIPAVDSLGPRHVGPRQALFLGRLIALKGVDDLLEAWSSVRPSDWMLRLVGPDPDGFGQRLRKRVKELGLQDTVMISDEVPPEHVGRLIQEASLVVLPSHSENYGFVIAEALARGTPVLTTTATPWAEITERGCGWCIADTVPAIADALRQATSESSEELTRRGALGRAWMKDEFAEERTARLFMAKVYEPALPRLESTAGR
jgi:glycosyltransferase involved in cell wall biosynthesis